MSYSITIHAEDAQAAREMVDCIRQHDHVSGITAKADGTTVTLTMGNSLLIDLFSGISALGRLVVGLFRKSDDSAPLRTARS